MKVKKIKRQLVLNKKTIANLRNEEMDRIQGGGFTKDLECESIFFCITEEFCITEMVSVCETYCVGCS